MIYIALLRGINVGGHKKILMAHLKTLCETLDFTQVQTYIQSGNLIFQSNETNATQLEQQLETAILKHYHFEVKVFVKTLEYWEQIVQNNPFLEEENPLDTSKLHLTFFSEIIEASSKLPKRETIDFHPEKYCIIDDVCYLYCANGYGNTKFSNPFFENKLKIKGTTRNWNTTLKLLELAKNKV